MKTDAQRQDDIEGLKWLPGRGRQYAAQKVGVLEKTQESEIRRQADDQSNLGSRTALYPESAAVVNQGQRSQQQ